MFGLRLFTVFKLYRSIKSQSFDICQNFAQRKSNYFSASGFHFIHEITERVYVPSFRSKILYEHYMMMYEDEVCTDGYIMTVF